MVILYLKKIVLYSRRAECLSPETTEPVCRQWDKLCTEGSPCGIAGIDKDPRCHNIVVLVQYIG